MDYRPIEKIIREVIFDKQEQNLALERVKSELIQETAISRIKSLIAQINKLASQNDLALRVENNTLKASIIQRKDI